MTQRTRFLGLDVHKQTIAAAICEDGGRPAPFGTIPNDPAAIRRLVRALTSKDPIRLVAAYEAGPTGFVLQRQLRTLGVECVVAAHSLLPRLYGDRVKTELSYALLLARLLL